MDIVSLIVQLISGAVGGNIAGAALKNASLGPVGNSILGVAEILAIRSPSVSGSYHNCLICTTTCSPDQLGGR